MGAFHEISLELHELICSAVLSLKCHDLGTLLVNSELLILESAFEHVDLHSLFVNQVPQLQVKVAPDGFKLFVEVVLEFRSRATPLLPLGLESRELIGQGGALLCQLAHLGIPLCQLRLQSFKLSLQSLHVILQRQDTLLLEVLLQLPRTDHALLIVLDIALDLGNQHIPLLHHLSQ